MKPQIAKSTAVTEFALQVMASRTRRRASLLILIMASILSAAPAKAQKTEVGVLVGGVITPNQTPPGGVTCSLLNPFCGAIATSDTAFAAEGIVARRLLHGPLVSLHAEVPVVGTFNGALRQGSLINKLSSVFVTPGVRLQFGPRMFAPFISAGGGLAHFSAHGPTSASDHASTMGTFQVGGGVDFNTPVPYLRIRGELRDFFTKQPEGFVVPMNRSHFFVGGGVVFKL